jgi:hypothetical protein
MGWQAQPYDPSLAALWDAIVRAARARHFVFERAYMDYHADRFSDGSLVLLDDGQPVAALPASRHGDELVSHGGLTFGALLSDERMTTARAVGALEAVVRRLRDDGVRRWTCKPLPHIYHLAAAEEDLYGLAVLGASLDRREASAAVRGGTRTAYSSERARAVRRARGEGLKVGRSDDFAEFLALVEDVLSRRHETSPVHSAAEMSSLAASFPDAIKLFAVRGPDGTMLAGTIVYETPAVAHAQYIACSDEGRRLRAQDGLFDHLLTDVYAAKPWFDFGISNERDGSLNAGLMRNKEGFGARCVVHDRYVMELSA